MICYYILLACLLESVVISHISTDPSELLNWCLDAMHHKVKPGPEEDLYSQCTLWKDRSCCTYNTTHRVHHEDMYHFNYNHCGHIKNMSEDCKKHFRQDSCFYECSPNTGPWVAKVNMKVRNERFFKVPLCKADCDSWWHACKDDYTCVDNWVSRFLWTTGGNECPDKSTCITFQEVYHNAENFCQTVWDESWDVKIGEPCMRLWFDSSKGNPNDNVAKLKVAELMKNSAHHIVFLYTWFTVQSSVLIILLL